MSRLKQLSIPKIKAVLAAMILAIFPASLYAGQDAVSPDAVRILKNSTDYLAGLQLFGLEADSSIEVVTESGQKIQFDNRAMAVVQRPNGFYAARVGDLVEQEFLYDGKTLTLHDADAGYYATVAAPDTLEAMLDFARESLDIVAPGGDFIYANAFDILMEDVETALLVGKSVIEGVVCDHLAFSKPGTDCQVWIARGEQPLPLKIVSTSRDVLSAPQFTVLIREWDIAVDVPKDKFQFTPPDDAQAVDFIMLEPAGD